MNRLCSVCGSEVSEEFGICRHHHLSLETGWAENNRAMCDFFHRGVTPPHLPKDNWDDF